MPMLARAVAVALLVSGPAGPAGGAPAPVRPGALVSVYDLYLGGIKGGEMVIAAWIGEGDYSAQAAMRTAGIVGLVYEAWFTAEVRGQVVGTTLEPGRFAAASAMEDKRQAVEMFFEGGAPAAVSAEPPFRPKPWEIVPAEQTGATDPLTAALVALSPRPPEAVCNRIADVFDGRRRYQVELGAPAPHQGRIRCPAVYRRVAGFKPKLMNRQAEFPFHVWFEVRSDGLAYLKRVAGDSMFGLIVILARD